MQCQLINVAAIGCHWLLHANRKIFSTEFIQAVKIEGWGRTRHGWYLGYYSQRWHKSRQPLDANGKPLRTGMVAVDPNLIHAGQHLIIPTLGGRLSRKVFVARDVGSAVKSHHIDIYTGEGKGAKGLASRVTGQSHTVCLSN